MHTYEGLIQGDSYEVVKKLKDASLDLQIHDPPYGINFYSGRRKRRGNPDFKSIQGDEKVTTEWMNDAYRTLKPGGAMYLFAHWKLDYQWQKAAVTAGFTVKNKIIWDKCVQALGDKSGFYLPQYEVILFCTKGRHKLRGEMQTDVIRLPRENPGTLIHPNQKPVSLYHRLILNSSDEGDVVGDFFAGSGSVAVASIQLGRKHVSIEKDSEWFVKAKSRIAAARPLIFQMR